MYKNSAASADNLASLAMSKPENKEGNLMRNQGSDIDLASLYNQQTVSIYHFVVIIVLFPV